MTSTLTKTWRTVRLGDVAGVLGGYAFQSVLFNTNNTGYPVVKIQNINNGTISIGSAEYVNVEKVDRDISKFKINKGDFLVAMTGATAGKVGLVSEEGTLYLNQRVGKFYSKDETVLDKKYLYYSVINPQNRDLLEKLADGSAQGNMSSSQIENSLEIFLPNIQEQKRIAEILSAFGDKIENNNRIIKTLEEMAQAIFKEWFVKFRFPGYEKAEFVDSELGKIPKGWEVKSTSEIVKRLPQGKTYVPEELKQKGEVPVYDQSSGIILGYHNEEPSFSPTIDEPVVLFGDHTCRMKLVINPCSLGPNVVPFTGIGYPTMFVYFLTHGKIAQREYKRHWTQFEQQEFVIPTRLLADAYVTTINPMVKKIVDLEYENQKLAAMRDLLLPRLMSGEIRV